MRRIIALATACALTTGCTATQLQWWRDADVDEQRAVVEHIIRSAADEFAVSADTMLALAQCESGMRPGAKNPRSSAAGLFQYLDTTWASARHRLYDRGIEAEPYSAEQVWDPVAQARTTASVIAEGGWWWECRRR